jgi:hypothetical protein
VKSTLGTVVSVDGSGHAVTLGRRTKEDTTSEFAIFGRFTNADNGDLSRELARYSLTLGFDDPDRARMRDLAERNQEGALALDEPQELQNFVKAGHMLAILHSKARRSLKAAKGPSGDHGRVVGPSNSLARGAHVRILPDAGSLLCHGPVPD